MNRNFIVFKNAEVLADQVSGLLMNQIARAKGSQFHLAISGGSTPNLLYAALASKYADSVLWQKAHFWWVDERMVSPDDPASNFGVVHQLLFSKIDIPEMNIHRIRGENEPFQEANNYIRQIKGSLNMNIGWPQFDLILLGMGEDGHTASIFPNHLELLNSERICEVVTRPDTFQQRITLTGKAINNAEKVCFLVTGANKVGCLSEILLKKEKAKLLPAAYIHPINGELVWYADESATSFLSSAYNFVI